MAEAYSLVADIGGTNARFALIADGDSVPLKAQSLRCAEFNSIVDAVHFYLDQAGLGQPYQAAISVASPVTGDSLHMTNHSWSFSVSETREVLDLELLKVLNDYTALALAVPFLKPDQLLQVGHGDKTPAMPMAVIGPGTGLGVSAVIPAGDHWIPLESEGGHVTYAGLTSREQEIVAILHQKNAHISAESVVSGPGLSRLYSAISSLSRGEEIKLTPSQITELALNNECEIASEVLSIFCAVLGTVAGNLALTIGARGGVYIGGGIIPRIFEIFKRSEFRQRFEAHGRFTKYLQAIPTYVIDAEFPALAGAVIALGEGYHSVGVSSRRQQQ